MTDVDVLPEDQQRINMFSKANLRLKDLEFEISQLRAKIATCKDCNDELQMCMDADGIMLAVGESYFPVDEETASEQVDKAQSLAEDLLAKFLSEEESLLGELKELKKVLYAKFGSTINLEDK